MPFVTKTLYITTPTKLIPYLASTLHISEKMIKRSIDKGRVAINHHTITSKKVIAQGEISIILFEPLVSTLKPLVEHPDFAIFDKPSGMLIHPKNLGMSHSLLDEVRMHYGNNANIVHRIDRETSGLVLISRHKEADNNLKSLFEERKVSKVYHAWVRGNCNYTGEIEASLMTRSLGSRHRIKSYVTHYGKYAITDISPLHYDNTSNTTLIEAHPLTGRLHQIRVHLESIGHSLVGDPLYGVPQRTTDLYLNGDLNEESRMKLTGANRVLLHAKKLSFFYKNKRYLFESELEF